MDRTTSVEMPAVHKQLAELYERVKFSLVLQPLSVALYASDMQKAGWQGSGNKARFTCELIMERIKT